VTKLRSIAVLMATLLLIDASVSARDVEASSGDEIIMNAWSDPTECNRANADTVSFEVLMRNADARIGDCVAVDGYWKGRALFGSARSARSDGALVSDRLSGKRLGLYAQWELIGDPPGQPEGMRFIGRVGQCETQWPEAIMVMGYCHYTGGPILLVSEAVAT